MAPRTRLTPHSSPGKSASPNTSSSSWDSVLDSMHSQSRTTSPPSLRVPLRSLEAALAHQTRLSESASYRRGVLTMYPTRIDYGNVSILISASPTGHYQPPSPSFAASSRTSGARTGTVNDREYERLLDDYARTLRAHRVHTVVRVCDPHYSADDLRKRGFEVVEMPYEDGSAPPSQVVNAWLALLDNAFGGRIGGSPSSSGGGRAPPPSATSAMTRTEVGEAVAIHCGAGLGRAPVLAAVALIELGMQASDAIGLIRTKRYGSINSAQEAFLFSYVPRRKQRAGGARHRRSRSSSNSSTFHSAPTTASTGLLASWLTKVSPARAERAGEKERGTGKGIAPMTPTRKLVAAAQSYVSSQPNTS